MIKSVLILGPYSGRSPDLIPKLRGVLTNPNCEYGANFVAIHTLAAWSKCTVDGCSSLSANDTVSADIKLELGDTSSGPPGDLVPPPPDDLPPHVYHPRLALKTAIKDWVTEFTIARNMWGPITKPQVGMNPTGIIQPSVNTCMTATTTTSSNMLLPTATLSENGSGGIPTIIPTVDKQLPEADLPEAPLLPTPIMCSTTPLVPLMNSFVSSNEVIMKAPIMDINTMILSSKPTIQPEPMETNLEADGRCSLLTVKHSRTI